MTELVHAGFSGIIVVATNPVVLMAYAALKRSELPAARVIGTGTLLDSCRMRQEIANRLHIAPTSVDGVVLGEHGDSEVAVLSSIRVGGLPLERFAPGEIDSGQIARDVGEAAYRIIAGKGYTSFGIATAAVQICEAIIRDEHVVLPVSSLLTGQFGISDIFISLPCLIGAGGIEQVLVPEMDDAETAAFLRSSAAVREALDAMPQEART